MISCTSGSLSAIISAMRLSISIAATIGARFDSSAVSAPIPGPISITGQRFSQAASAIVLAAVSLAKKFCPSALLGVRPYFSSSHFTEAVLIIYTR